MTDERTPLIHPRVSSLRDSESDYEAGPTRGLRVSRRGSIRKNSKWNRKVDQKPN